MELDYSDVKNLRWGNAEKTAILCDVLFTDHPMLEIDQYVPFYATKEDPHNHGQEIFERGSKGDFGKIGKYIAPKEIEQSSIDPVQKLKNFLAKNPDVAILLQGDSQ